MDILTYILAKNSGGNNGASAPIQESDILSALDNNKDTVKNSLGIDELNNEVAEIQAITDDVITNVIIADSDDGNGNPIALTTEDHELQIPLASADTLGFVKGIPNNLSAQEKTNKILINNDGLMEVYSLNSNKLVQTDVLILDGGNASNN